jgi:L-malate glycosyltransferase
MRILLLADISSSHTLKWANSLSFQGIEIFIFTLSYFDHIEYSRDIQIISGLETTRGFRNRQDGDFSKVIYIFALKKLKKTIKEIQPDIIHAHYMTSYGLLGVLSGFKPFIATAWGSDIFSFPKKSLIHRRLLTYLLNKPIVVLSSSNYMLNEINKYTTRKIGVINFGVDTEIFKPDSVEKKNETITIGIIKPLEKTYGIEYLIEAFKLLVDNNSPVNLKLFIVGDGSNKTNLENYVREINITKKVKFFGQIPYKNIAEIHKLIDIEVYPSIQESFGVAAIEGMACGNVVIASNLDGYKEIIEDNVSGFLINPKDTRTIAALLKKLISDHNLRQRVGERARNRVLEKFEWEKNVKQMILVYSELLMQRRKSIKNKII